jgi:hypothetical protein
LSSSILCWIGRSGPSKFPLEISILSRIFSRVSYRVRELSRGIIKKGGKMAYSQHFSELIRHLIHLRLELTDLLVFQLDD